MEEKNKFYCPDCGNKMNEIYKKPALNLTCPKCGNQIATTKWEKIDLDTTKYMVFINSVSKPSTLQIKIISKITGNNFISSKKLLEDGGVIYESLATNIRPILNILIENDLSYSIFPEYPYI